MVKFTEIIEASIEWTTTVLFRPFSPKKWFILVFVALLAGQLAGGGCNSFSPGRDHTDKTKPAQAAEIYQASISYPTAQTVNKKSTFSPSEILKSFSLKKSKNPALFLYIVAIAVLVILAFLVLTWLTARFSFIFLEDVIKNDASIKMPFRENKQIANSLFLFYLVSSVVFLALFGLLTVGLIYNLINLGVFQKEANVGFKQIFLTCLPYGLLLFSVIFIALLISLIAQDFVLVVMFKDKIKIMKAWRKILAMLRVHKVDFVKYLCIKLGLAICSAIIAGLLSFITFIGLLLPGGITVAVFYLIYLILPKAFRLLYSIILFMVGIPLFLFLLYCLTALNLPFAVFFRTFSLKFLARLDQNYNLFKQD
ncbi:MAG: hypothetical protein AB1629_01690 [Candidatus Omnitrophota bacterium]